ncbi:HD domain-containing phosphohydrolase (plasmid) [Deinococcus radiomollis]|uniref:HD domain-containing phosphohydrolase n=1 Tax=Deinococcus radiomollis TaxID=468916 RepID=UPI003892A2B0
MSQKSSPASHTSLDWIDDVIYVIDADSRLTYANTCALNHWRKQLHEVVGHPLEDLVPHVTTKEIHNAFTHALYTQQRTQFDTIGVRHRKWINVTLHPHRGGLIVHIRPLLRNSEVPGPEAFDALTGCLTRAAFQTALNVLDKPQVLAIVDLNGLKSVNTLRGHSGGDTHIRTIARAVQEALPENSLMCRWGGDEFVILTPGTDPDALYVLLEAAETNLPGPARNVTAYAVGLTVWDTTTPFERAFSLTDEQLQLRKEHLREQGGTSTDESLVTFSQELEALRDPDDLIQHALNRLLDLLDFDQAVYAPWEGDDNYASHQATRAGGPPIQPPLGVRVPITKSGLVQRVQRTLTTAWNTDYPNEITSIPVILQSGVKSVIVTPVFSQGKIIATLVLRAMNRWQTITPHMRKVVELTALRLEHALELRRAVGEIRSTLEAGMLTLGLVLEARDSDTQGHTTRANGLSQQLGERLGLNADALDHLRQGAYLHDLGKLSIPDDILRKPGRLTPQEWVIMQGHVVKGYELATRIPGLPQGVLDVIRSHHERWDGTGYPDALSGTAIPLGARIFAVCDVYDALISARPYKEAWTHEEAVAEITRQSGRHFDPEVVQAFLHLAQHQPE